MQHVGSIFIQFLEIETRTTRGRQASTHESGQLTSGACFRSSLMGAAGHTSSLNLTVAGVGWYSRINGMVRCIQRSIPCLSSQPCSEKVGLGVISSLSLHICTRVRTRKDYVWQLRGISSLYWNSGVRLHITCGTSDSPESTDSGKDRY